MPETTKRTPTAHTELRRQETEVPPDDKIRQSEKGQGAPKPRPDPEDDDLFNDLPV